MRRTLADELAGEFDNMDLSPADTLELMETETPKGSHNETTEGVKSVNVVFEEHVEPTAARLSTSSAIANAGPESSTDLVNKNKESTTANTVSNTTLCLPPRESNFVEHLSPGDSSPQPTSYKEHTKKLALINNRELIDRKPNGFFDMETMPSANDVQRRVQQSEGIAALQRTLVPATCSDAASSSTGSSHASSSTAVDSVKRPSALRQVTFAEPRGRRSKNISGPYPHTADRTKAAPRFSLGRDLIAAGHKKKVSEPSAPTRFVRLPTDPVVNFKRNFSESGLKVMIPQPELDEIDEGSISGSIAASPEFDSMDGITFVRREPDVATNLEFGVRRVFMPNQCQEPSCPLRFAHAIGPYHHKNRRDSRIMTGLFGHANPPPEIWNAYRSMVHLTSKGEYVSPDGRCGSEADQDSVIAFAMFHFGGLNGMSGEEFHRRYAGRHMSSRIALRSSKNKESMRQLVPA